MKINQKQHITRRGIVKKNPKKFSVGDKVIFKEDWDIFPFDIVYKGEIGRIVRIESIGDQEYPNKSVVYVKLKKLHPKLLDEWNNEAYLGIDDRKPIDYIKVIV